MTVYNKTVFNEGAAPGISAAELNKIGDGIASAHSELDSHIAAAPKYLKATVTTDASGDAVIALPVAPTDILSAFTPNQGRIAHYPRVNGTQLTVRIAKLSQQDVTGVTYDKATGVGSPTNLPSGVNLATGVQSTGGPSATQQSVPYFNSTGTYSNPVASGTHTHQFPYLYDHKHGVTTAPTAATVSKGLVDLPSAAAEANIVVYVLYV